MIEYQYNILSSTSWIAYYVSNCMPVPENYHEVNEIFSKTPYKDDCYVDGFVNITNTIVYYFDNIILVNHLYLWLINYLSLWIS